MKMYEGKRVIGVNIVYMLAHDLEIIEDTSALLNPNHFEAFKVDKNLKLRQFWDALQQKHLHETGNWYIFDEGDRFVGPDESIDEALDRIDREYCEKTGRWELFIWNDEQK